jgi:ankyrin repeat protein
VIPGLGQTPLFHPAALGLADLVGLLLAFGGAVHHRDQWGLTALHYAGRHGHAAVAALLLRAGADPNAADPAYGFTPLHEAAAGGHLAAARLLLAAGANPTRALSAGYGRCRPGDTPANAARRAGHRYLAGVLRAAPTGREKEREGEKEKELGMPV